MKVLVVLGSKSDLKVVESGIVILRDWQLAHSLRIASAHRSPQLLATVVDEFTQQGGAVIICVAGKAAHLAGTVAARTVVPVIAVPLAQHRDRRTGLTAVKRANARRCARCNDGVWQSWFCQCLSVSRTNSCLAK